MRDTVNYRSSIIAGRRGIALLMVLLIVMAIAILSLGFLARADVELSCGENMALRMQMDQLADSALEHAKGLLLHPQNATSDYWRGATLRQLTETSKDYYDVNVVRDATDYCTYTVTCEAYRLKGAQKVGVSRLSAEFRLDPVIGLWTGSDLAFQATWSVQGDIRAAGRVVNLGPAGAVAGDVFSTGLTGGATGAAKPLAALSLAWPPVTSGYLNPDPAYLSPCPISCGGTLADTTLQPSRIWSYTGDLTLGDNVTIEGMLLVDGNVIISGSGSAINPAKNLPALYVSKDVIFRGASDMQINGLAVVDGKVLVGADSTGVAVLGGLFANGQVAETAVDSSGRGNDAVVYSRPVWRPTTGGRIGGALEFDGLDDYLRTPDNSTSLQLTEAYTLSVWIKPAATQKDWAAILCKTEPNGMSPSSNHWSLQLDEYGEKLLVFHPGAFWDTGILLAQMNDGAWHHVAVVRQTDGTMVSYLDSLDGTPYKTMDANDPFKSKAPGSGEGHLNIGADGTASPDFVYAGLIDDVRVYDRALTQGEVRDLATMNHVTGNLIGHWRLDEAGSGVTITAEPARAAIVALSAGMEEHWGQATDGFFRRISREQPY